MTAQRFTDVAGTSAPARGADVARAATATAPTIDPRSRPGSTESPVPGLGAGEAPVAADPRIDVLANAAPATPAPAIATIAAGAFAAQHVERDAQPAIEAPRRRTPSLDAIATTIHATTPRTHDVVTPVDAARDVAALADDAAAQRLERQTAVVAAVSRMTLRHGAHAEVDVPSLGRVRVDVRGEASALDVTVQAARPEAVHAIAAARPALEAELRDGGVGVSQLTVRGESSSSSSSWDASSRSDARDANTRDGARDGRDARDGARDDRDAIAETSRTPANRGRVRIVL